MSRHTRDANTATSLMLDAGNAAASVVTQRVLAFANPAQWQSPWHQAEASRMSSEKLEAAQDGMLGAGMAAGMLPMRLWQLAARPSTWTPAGWTAACMEAGGLWLAVGSAALRPGKATAVRNQKRLARRLG